MNKTTFESTREFLSVDDVARYLGVSRALVRLWISQSKLTTLRVGRVLRIRRGSLDAFVKRNEQLAGTEKENVQ